MLTQKICFKKQSVRVIMYQYKRAVFCLILLNFSQEEAQKFLRGNTCFSSHSLNCLLTHDSWLAPVMDCAGPCLSGVNWKEHKFMNWASQACLQSVRNAIIWCPYARINYDLHLNVPCNLFTLWFQPTPMSPNQWGRRRSLWIIHNLQIILSTQKLLLIYHKQWGASASR